MWSFTQNQRRKKILETGFPAVWEEFLEKNVVHFQRLNESKRMELRKLVQVFVAEKNWEACGGLVLTDEIRVTIAAQACILILNLPHDLYRKVESILVYPSTVIRPERSLGFFEIRRDPIPASSPILGEAQFNGPVILVWDSVLQNARHPEAGHNVVYHEFAHKLDMLDGNADGTPPLENAEQYARWNEVCSKEFLHLRAFSKSGKPSFLDSYGAVNEAEFFAVITEQFFDKPESMLKHSPDLYSVLKEFYRQDPATSA